MLKLVRGSTATEVATIVAIFGILAAFAFPRYATLKSESQKALVRSLSNNVQVSAQVAHLQWIIQNRPATIVIDRSTITMRNGYPDQASIRHALLDFSGFKFVNSATANFQKIDASLPTSCMVTYAEAAQGSSPVIDALTSGC